MLLATNLLQAYKLVRNLISKSLQVISIFDTKFKLIQDLIKVPWVAFLLVGTITIGKR